MKPETRKDILMLGAFFLLVLGGRTAVAEPRYIPSSSMVPTLQIQDKLVVEKLSRQMSPPERGDILVFDLPHRPEPQGLLEQISAWQGMGVYTPLIKRVVGLPGETIAVRAGKVWIDGKPLHEPYIKEAPAYEMAPVEIPAGHLFMMGDNRNNSADSHVWGPLPISNVRGRAVFRFWPLNHVGTLDSRG